MILITYVPFYRLHEIEDYFIKNIEIIKPEYSMVYIDNIYSEKQINIVKKVINRDIEIVFGNWRSRGGTWLKILNDMHNYGKDIVVIDSDNVLDARYPKIHGILKKYDIYTLLDYEGSQHNITGWLRRSKYVGDININGEKYPIYMYRIKPRNTLELLLGKGSPFFIGPKQLVYISKPLDLEVLEKVEKAFNNIEYSIRNNISDEAVLGVVLYLCNYEEIPWTIATHHYRHKDHVTGYMKTSKIITAIAHIQFSNGLIKEFKRNEFRLYKLKYLVSLFKNIIY
ncbi:MAG: hypothetical protein QXL96_02785 [Ignisphaera sp.]